MASDDNLTRQSEEMEALSSIYGQDVVQIHEENSMDIQVDNVNLRVNFPPEYPEISVASYQLSAPFLDRTEKEVLDQRFQEVSASNAGEPVVFAWVECLRDFLQQKSSTLEVEQVEVEKVSITKSAEGRCCPEIVTGGCLEDRKSVFQGHYAHVKSVEQVKAVLEKLYENRKVANATHNMYAYRIQKPDGKVLLQDCDDDGETHAGSRMLHLLEILNCIDTLVVVSRWYGGIQLGPDRFKHINNAARMVLEQAQVVAVSKKDSKSAKSGKKK